MDDFLFDLMQHDDFENMYFCQEKTSGLKAVIAIHDTTLGAAAGGIRITLCIRKGRHPGCRSSGTCYDLQMGCGWH